MWLRRAVDPPSIVNAVRNTAFESTILAVLEVLRNILVLVPVLLTWWGLRYAADAYAKAVTRSGLAPGALSSSLGGPLWQRSRHLVGPGTRRSSEIATWDVGVLGSDLARYLADSPRIETWYRRAARPWRAYWSVSCSIVRVESSGQAGSEHDAACRDPGVSYGESRICICQTNWPGYNQQIAVSAEARQIETDGLLRGSARRCAIPLAGSIACITISKRPCSPGARSISAALSDQLCRIDRRTDHTCRLPAGSGSANGIIQPDLWSVR